MQPIYVGISSLSKPCHEHLTYSLNTACLSISYIFYAKPYDEPIFLFFFMQSLPESTASTPQRCLKTKVTILCSAQRD